ncbi:MAG TPA: hypothetical protein PLN33_09380 [Hyphomonadaceae bacterium]|nr:hypothetical protein [Hyphomonadaceae bacterium]HPN05766.1 hypothetical protein [Hyphomonadaceae bacterium]
MTATPDPSTRRVLWWARSFGRPLQNEFAQNAGETPDELTQLLEMADRRISESTRKDET